MQRGDPELPAHCVRTLPGMMMIERLRSRLGYSDAASFAWYDEIYSREAGASANRTKAHLLLYSPYAWEAFAETRYPRHTPRKVLFQYHPHPDYERRVLAEDLQSHPEVHHSYAEATNQNLSPRVHKRQADCWRHADLIISASTFTQKTLLAAGADPRCCHVVPYGVSPLNVGAHPPEVEASPTDGCFRALFVGSGIQRKGLHHLLDAWRAARLPTGSELTLICRNLDPGLEAAVAASPFTFLRRHVSGAELTRLYLESSLLVMPSLIEGFGQVFLEALSHGCPVLGTANTCLPDLGRESDGVFILEHAQTESLVAALERLAQMLPANLSIRKAAQKLAREFDWPSFRQGINASLSR